MFIFIQILKQQLLAISMTGAHLLFFSIYKQHSIALEVELLCCLMTPGLSKDNQSYVTYNLLYAMLANHQIRHQATCKMGRQPGDCR